MESEVVLAKSGEFTVIARQRGKFWRVYFRQHEGDKLKLLKYAVPARYRDDVYDGIEVELSELAHRFGYTLSDCGYLCSNFVQAIYADDDSWNRIGDDLSGLIHETVLQAYRKRQWNDAAGAESERVYWATKSGLCACTRDERMMIWRDMEGESLILKRDIREKIPRDLPITENPAWLPLSEPDCFAEVNGEWVACDSLKSIRAAVVIQMEMRIAA